MRNLPPQRARWLRARIALLTLLLTAGAVAEADVLASAFIVRIVALLAELVWYGMAVFLIRPSGTVAGDAPLPS